MTQTISQSVRHFRKGFSEGYREADDRRSDRRAPGPALQMLGDLFLVALFGFILVSPGVPFLPWGEPGGIAAALVALAAVAAIRHAHDWPAQLGLIAVVFGCSTLAARSEGVSTSVLLAGAVVAAFAQIAKQRPFLYGLAFGVFLGGITITLFGFRPPFGEVELIFTGQPYSAEAAAQMATRVAAIMLLAGLQHLAASEIRRERVRADAADSARDEAAVDERARIARELHDVVSHHVTAMTLQAEAAAATGDRKALTSLANSGREAAAELRRMLGVLRRPPGDLDGAAADPQPRLDDLDSLVRRLSSGLDVKLERTGKVRPLSAGVELCAYRVIQEALTNVAKHSEAREAQVVLDYGTDHLSLEVFDDGGPIRATAVDESGHGLIGMRERVSLLEGTLAAGPRDDGHGYRVFARIPLQPSAT